MNKRMILIQTCVCIIFVLTYFVIGMSDSEKLHDFRGNAVAAISKNYTVSDIMDKGKDTALDLVKSPAVLSAYIVSVQEEQMYGKPVDEVETGESTFIYSVAGGQVVDIGETEIIGKYIEIKHDEATSIYGNCTEIYVKEGEHVRRGHIIGSYINEENTPFYYELIRE